MLNLANLHEVKNKLNDIDVKEFQNINNSYRFFLNEIEIIEFRHLVNLKIPFEHPVTVLTGTNKIGKTSILLLIACSHENFFKMDSTSPDIGMRIHIWKDMLAFTKYENTTKNYSYKLTWRVGNDIRHGEGKRLATSKAWSGLGKKSSNDSRINSKIKDKHVRLIDLERILPLRNFSNSLLRKTQTSERIRLHEDVEQAYGYIFDILNVQIYQIGIHINKVCYLINHEYESYSSYNAASGEEAMITILKDIIEAPNNSLILIDEIEAGFHPTLQRKLADILQYLSWRDKKQFIITTHSPTLISAFPQKSRKFIDRKIDGSFEVINKISKQAAFSKMDAKAYPLINLYCEDDEAEFLIKKVILSINLVHKHFGRLINIIKSGPIYQVKNDYERHKRNYKYMSMKTGYCCVFDGDYKNNPDYSNFYENINEFSFFIYPYDAPEKFLIKAYLYEKPNDQLKSALTHNDHHSLFNEMVTIGLATDDKDARNQCFEIFKMKPEYRKLECDLRNFLEITVSHFSELSD